MTVDSGPASAIVFPGISPTSYRKSARFLLLNPIARALTRQADEALGYDLIEAYHDAEGEYPEPARVAFMVSCLALAQWAEDEIGPLRFCVGPSFGGTPAAVRAGALSFADGIRLTARWGQYADEYFAGAHSDLVTQSFARTGPEVLAQVQGELTERGAWSAVAAQVDEDFYLLNLPGEQVDWLKGRLRTLGGLPLYTMRPPMHSEIFQPLRDAVERDLFTEVDFHDPVVPIICDHDGSVLGSADQVRTMLLDSVVKPVQWPAVARRLASAGVERIQVAGRDGLWGRVACLTQHFRVDTVTPDGALRPRRSAAV